MKITFPGPAGPLEGLLELPDERAPRFGAVVCHPHPIHGGTMHNTVVFRVARGLRDAGSVTLRFNFRGVGESAGEHRGDTGPEGEEGDALAALNRLAEDHRGLPLWGAGFSFGARVIASLARREPRLERLVLVAAPVDLFDCEAVARAAVPALAVWGDRDEFGTLRSFERRYPDASPLLEKVAIEGADHLFRGRTPLLEEVVREYALRSLEPTS